MRTTQLSQRQRGLRASGNMPCEHNIIAAHLLAEFPGVYSTKTMMQHCAAAGECAKHRDNAKYPSGGAQATVNGSARNIRESETFLAAAEIPDAYSPLRERLMDATAGSSGGLSPLLTPALLAPGSSLGFAMAPPPSPFSGSVHSSVHGSVYSSEEAEPPEQTGGYTGGYAGGAFMGEADFVCSPGAEDAGLFSDAFLGAGEDAVETAYAVLQEPAPTKDDLAAFYQPSEAPPAYATAGFLPYAAPPSEPPPPLFGDEHSAGLFSRPNSNAAPQFRSLGASFQAQPAPPAAVHVHLRGVRDEGSVSGGLEDRIGSLNFRLLE